jgi:hypothetical protein
MAAVPADAAVMIEVEVMDFLSERRKQPGMLQEVTEQRGGAALLGSDDEE